ncbi:MAG: ArnT family glycosyltransferase [Bryobacteraceae bacterium]
MREVRTSPARWLLWATLPLIYCAYFYRLTAAGVILPDEPRYASVARAMANTGDVVTPRLWGEPWFEKPALYYWLAAMAFRFGAGPDLAPRLPVALLSVVFLFFFYGILRREFGWRAAAFAALILATSGEWLLYSQVGVTDIPMAATFAAGMLLAIPWISRGDQQWLPWSGAMFGLAILAKGLVPVALALPLLLGVRHRFPRALGRIVWPCLAVAAPWYVACYLKNGVGFLKEFFWKQHVERAFSGALMHSQPFWYYAPVLLLALVPWTPLAVLAATRFRTTDMRRRFLFAWAIWGLLFFSLPVNKLPGYLLPLLPAVAALAGVTLNESAAAPTAGAGNLRAGNTGFWLAACALLLAAFPIAGPMLPEAIAWGSSKAAIPPFRWTWLLPLLAAGLVWFLEARGMRLAAVFLIAAGAAMGIVYWKTAFLPEVDRTASARPIWRRIAPVADQVCVDNIHRNWRYGLNYYTVTPLPECSVQARPLHIQQIPGQPPQLVTVDPLAYRIVRSQFQEIP